jgi:hypothetical protein
MHLHSVGKEYNLQAPGQMSLVFCILFCSDIIEICSDCAEGEPVPTAIVVGTGIPIQVCMGEEIIVVNALT